VSDIVERLRHPWAIDTDDGAFEYIPIRIGTEAAAEIERLRDRVKELEAELAAWKAVAEKRHAILLDLEWCVDCHDGYDSYCPFCVAFDGEKHTAGCKMDEAIAQSSRAATDAVVKENAHE